MSRQQLKIPNKLSDILEQPQMAVIESCAYKYGQILHDNKVIFFPEYTDHGIEHVESVLLSAIKIISEESYEYLNADDVMVLILSIILHDLGMHISVESFLSLIESDSNDLKCNDLDAYSWKISWEEYIHEAKRFNDAQLLAIFGDENTEITDIDFEKNHSYSIRLAGEFLRRMHPRLAHEIALIGFPVKDGEDRIILSNDLEESKADLAGLVARSHGMNLRDTFDYLEKQYKISWSAPYNIKVVFHMAVLRIADYIQIESDRASEIVLKTKRLSSPVSKQEWEKHKSIEFINTEVSDPERIYVQANPLSSEIYLGLEKLFKGIQWELDVTWAVLGEVYGRSKQRNIGLNYRRIQSNIDDKKGFQKNINYIADKVKFDADPGILKLLIGPLYGEDPTFGVRELLQNAVDAVKERKYIETAAGNSFDDRIHIELKKKGDSLLFCLTDNGIGMGQDTLIHYFFKAGASFRKSESWLKDFTKDGNVKVERTGRFGVGVLAAFLLGSKIMVRTKNMNQDYGLTFETELSSGQIELNKVDCDIGTYMEITLTDKVVRSIEESESEIINWFTWYRLKSPKIDITVPEEYKNKFIYLEEDDFFPSEENQDATWRRFTKDGYTVLWSLESFNRRTKLIEHTESHSSQNNLLINGFNIPDSFRINEKYNWATPLVSIIDKNGKAPLSLNRNYLLNNKLPFEKELLKRIATDAIKTIFNVQFEKIGDLYRPQKNTAIINLAHKENFSDHIIIYDDHYTIDHQFVHHERGTSKTYSIWMENNSDNIGTKIGFHGYSVQDPLRDTIVAYSRTIGNEYNRYNLLNEWFTIGDFNGKASTWDRIYMKKKRYEYLFDDDKMRIKNSFKSSVNIEDQSENWICFNRLCSDDYRGKSFPKSHYELDNSNIKLEELEKESKNIDLIIEHKFGYLKPYFGHYYSDDYSQKEKIDPEYKKYSQFASFEKLIEEYLPKDLLIPIDKVKRGKLLKKIILELDIN